MPFGNPQTGPIYVEGAEPGDALAVTIESISPLIGQCATRTGEARQLTEWLGADCPHGTRVCPIREGMIHWSDRIQIPYEPMLGCIGTAPTWVRPARCRPAPTGATWTLSRFVPAARCICRSMCPGGFLYLGDAHAAMGHGELSASGLEMPAESVITIGLAKQRKLPGRASKRRRRS